MQGCEPLSQGCGLEAFIALIKANDQYSFSSRIDELLVLCIGTFKLDQLSDVSIDVTHLNQF